MKFNTKDMPPNEAARGATFKAATKGLSAYKTALVCNTLRPAFDFRGEAKSVLMKEFCSGYLSHISGQQLRDVVTKLGKEV